MIVLTVGMLSVEILTLGVSANAATAQAPSQPLPQSTAIPVRFERSVDAKKAKPGDTVTAKTMQVIVLPGGEAIAKGTVIVGHVVTAQSFQFDSTPYAHQQPSTLSIHFDKLQQGVAGIPINLSVRAMAGAIDSQQATYPHSTDDTDHVGTMTLIGGTSFSPLEKRIQSDDGDAIGYNRKDGVFAKADPDRFFWHWNRGTLRWDKYGTICCDFRSGRMWGVWLWRSLHASEWRGRQRNVYARGPRTHVEALCRKYSSAPGESSKVRGHTQTVAEDANEC